MEKDYRLFVKNLPLNIDDDGLRKIFHKFVTIKKIDLKEKKDLNNKVNKFAFVNVTTTDKGLNECFGKLNGERFDGFEISIELAKESFLDRLKREREESNQKKEPPKDYTKPFVFETLTSTKSKHKKFDDVDFSSKEFEVEKVKKKRKSSVDDTNDLEACPVQNLEDVEYKIKDFEETSNSFKVEKKKYVNKLDAASTDINNVHRNKKAKKANEFKNNKSIKYPVHEAPISESEQKRLMSLKEKKKVFKAQEKVIRNALKSVDEARLNKKIIFDDDIDIESTNKNTQSQKKKNALFESDSEEEAEEFGWDEEEVEAKANTKKKLLKMQTSIGNDKRFVLDERFVDDDDAENVKESINSGQNDDATLDEKKWTLGILEQVLGKPIAPPTATSGDTVQPKKKMIRYDPTADGHEKYEVAVEKSKEEKRKKKKKKVATEQVDEEKEEAPIPTSKEIFYDVSDKLADSFKPAEGFSLLKTLGRDAETDKPKTKPVKEIENNESGFQFSFTKNKNPFNYDSSDNEDGKGKGQDDYNFKLNSNETFEDDEGLFAPLRDSQVEELNKFFNTPSTVDDEAFKRRRRELKKIVRTKIRNNVKKATPWNKRKVWKQKKKQR